MLTEFTGSTEIFVRLILPKFVLESRMSEIDTLNTIDELFSKFSQREAIRSLAWLNAKYGDRGKANASNPSMRRNRETMEFLDSLDLSPPDAQSAKEFIDHNKPENNKMKCLLAVYYIEKIIEEHPISLNHVFTFFKVLGWKIPADLSNTLHQTAADGYLLTSQASDLALTPHGISGVEDIHSDLEIYRTIDLGVAPSYDDIDIGKHLIRG